MSSVKESPVPYALEEVGFFFKKQTSHYYFTAPYVLYKSWERVLLCEHSMEQATPTLNMNTLPHCLLCSRISVLSMPAGSLSSMFPVTKLAHKTCSLGSNPFSAPSATSTVRGVKRKNMLYVMLGPSKWPATARTRNFNRSICLEVLLTR